MQSGALALIVAPQGRLSDGWRALLLATPRIADVRQAHDASSALEVAGALGPDLVLLDADALGEMAWALLDQVKGKALHCCCIALICSARQRAKALASGADAVLIKGFPAAQLSTAIDRLLTPQAQDEKRAEMLAVSVVGE